jgi:hypothetical protein
MANISQFAQKLLLDFITGAATATQPAARFVSLAWGTPGAAANAASEINATMGFTRQTALFLAANSPAGTASNSASMTFGPWSSVNSILGAHMWDAQGAGNYLLMGTLATARTVGIGDTLVFAAGALNIQLS